MIDIKYKGNDINENKYIQALIDLDMAFIHSKVIWYKGGIGNLDYPSCFIKDSWIEDCSELKDNRYDIHKKISYIVIIHPHFFPFLFTTLLEYFDANCKVIIQGDEYYRCVFQRTILKEKHTNDHVHFDNEYYPSIEFIQSLFDKYKQKTRFIEILRRLHTFLLSKRFIIFIMSFILAGVLFEIVTEWAFIFGIASFIIISVQESISRIKKKTEYATILIHQEYILRFFNYFSIILIVAQIIIIIYAFIGTF